MNYLAHLYLAGEDHELIIGNFIADAVKGKQIETFSEGIRKGIEFDETHVYPTGNSNAL